MIFWNDEFAEGSQGLDIIGIRAIDQKLEANLVNGITTISAHGRYFSILPWAISQFYQSLLAENAPFDLKALGAFLQRAEFLVIAASLLDPAGKPGGAILGSEVYREEMAKLQSGAPIPFPSSTGSRMLGRDGRDCQGSLMKAALRSELMVGWEKEKRQPFPNGQDYKARFKTARPVGCGKTRESL